MVLDDDKIKVKNMLIEYVRGNINRKELVEYSERYYNINKITEEAHVYFILERIYGDAEDNPITIDRKDLVKTIENYIKDRRTLNELQLWFWDVLNFNIYGSDSEEKLISFILYTFDNLDINEISDPSIRKVYEILINTCDSELALKNVKEVISR